VSCLVNLLHVADRTLRSPVSKHLSFVPTAKLSIGKGAFSVAAPRIWNQLHITVKSSESMATFRKQIQNIFVALTRECFGLSMLQRCLWPLLICDYTNSYNHSLKRMCCFVHYIKIVNRFSWAEQIRMPIR